jgi:hypothetical protein
MESIKIQASAKQLMKLGKLKAEKSALEKEISSLEKEIGIPKGEAIKAIVQALAISPGDKIQIPLINGNTDEVGTMAIFWHGGAQIPPGWRSRVNL